MKHRSVIQRILRRKLEPGERVHHRNGNKRDNRPENLELYHVKETSVIFGLNGRWSRLYDQCVICGSREAGHVSKGRCWRCYQHIKSGTVIRSRGLNGKWSHRFNECSTCNSTRYAHHSLGLCKVCYDKQYRIAHSERRRETLKQWKLLHTRKHQ